MIARILSILSHRVSTLGLKLKETVQSWLLTSWDPCCEHNQYEPFLLMVFSGELLTKTWIFVNLTKVLEYLDKYQVLWPSSTSKYQVLLNLKRSSTSKYQVLDNLHQVPSTKYKYFTWPQPWWTTHYYQWTTHYYHWTTHYYQWTTHYYHWTTHYYYWTTHYYHWTTHYYHWTTHYYHWTTHYYHWTTHYYHWTTHYYHWTTHYNSYPGTMELILHYDEQRQHPSVPKYDHWTNSPFI